MPNLSIGGSSNGASLDVNQSCQNSPVDISTSNPDSGSQISINPYSCVSCYKYTNVYFVDSSGDNSTGTKGDIFLPFKTIDSAISAASVGDLVFVMNGVYPGFTIKSGIDVYLNGATISSSGVAINASVSGDINIFGKGSVYGNTAIDISNPGASINVYDISLNCSGVGSTINMTDGVLNLNNCDVINTSGQHGLTTSITSTSYNLRINSSNFYITSGLGISSSNTFKILLVTDFGSTKDHSSTVSAYNDGMFIFVNPNLSWK